MSFNSGSIRGYYIVTGAAGIPIRCGVYIDGIQYVLRAISKRDFGSRSRRSQNLNRGILRYSEDLNFGFNKDIGPEVFFEMACHHITSWHSPCLYFS